MTLLYGRRKIVFYVIWHWGLQGYRLGKIIHLANLINQISRTLGNKLAHQEYYTLLQRKNCNQTYITICTAGRKVPSRKELLIFCHVRHLLVITIYKMNNRLHNCGQIELIFILFVLAQIRKVIQTRSFQPFF